ncbi:MAG: MG2 domain-containing protein [Myxococcota bacterium]
MKAPLLPVALLAAFIACKPPPSPPDATPTTPPVKPPPVAVTPPPAQVDPAAPGKKAIVPPVKADPAPQATPRLAQAPKAEDLQKRISSYFESRGLRRIHIQTDKPLYKPGETVWIKTWDLTARDLTGSPRNQGMRYELISPKGAVVLNKMVRQERGTSTNDFELPDGVQGGEYLIRVHTMDDQREERPIILSTYEPPRIKKKLEFVRKAYGAGDEVTATLELKRPTGEAMGNHPVVAAIRLDGADLPRVSARTNTEGGALVRFNLPRDIQVGDGLLTVLVEDGGVTESVSKRIPIVLKKLQFSLFPEGGQMVAGVPTRMYLEARNPIGKPADVEGRVVDDHGNAVATFKTHHDGLGRVTFTPSTGRTYHAEITRPVGITEHYAFPLAAEAGCVLSTYDDLDGELTALRAQVRCSDSRKVLVTASLRDNHLDTAAVEVKEGQPAVVYLQPRDEALARAPGIARVTVLDEDFNPLAERLVFRNRRNTLQVKVEPHKKGYSPREQVTLTVTTTDSRGQPIPSELALSVVDDTVISFADDKTGHMLSRIFLEPEIPGKVEEPNVYFDLTEAKSALAMDLLMGTRGYRRFEWHQALTPPIPEPSSVAEAMPMAAGAMPMDDAEGGAVRARPRRQMDFAPAPKMPAKAGAKGDVMEKQVAAAPPPPPAAPPAAQPAAPAEAPAVVAQKVAREEKPMAGARMNMAMEMEARDEMVPAQEAVADKDWAGAEKKKEAAAWSWAPVRVFPAPVYRGDETGPRTDFRETIHWQPSVLTGKDGKATVTFYLSDAVTSFRVFSEGVGGGLAGRDETVFESSLPFSMSVKLPLEVSAGDKLLLPLTLTNESDKPLDIELDATFGNLLTLTQPAASKPGQLAAGTRNSLFYPVEVTGRSGTSKVAFYSAAGGLKDEFSRDVVVTPVGFPQQWARSGQVKDTVSHDVDLGAAVPGSVVASVRVYPSPVATLVSGLEGMLREPSGCFEQTSSTNYPNVMVMQYLKQHNVDDPQLMERSAKLLDTGYKRLVGYESPNKGYEWFGSDPGHEALTAYGLVEFADMKQVHGDVDSDMMARTAAWLRSRRDGKGGYQRDPKALDSFGAASPEVTNAYITYALTEAGFTDLDAELDLASRTARETHDAYILALTTNTLLNVPARKSEGKAAAQKLAGMQGQDGAWTEANHSITRSGGQNLHIETTSLAVMALLKSGDARAQVDRGVQWLANNRGGFGQWGATQATVLALKAMTQYANATRRTQSAGTITVYVNGNKVEEQRYEAGRREPVELTTLGQHLRPGKNTIQVKHNGKEELPYSVAVEFRSAQPASSAEAVVGLKTSLERTEVKMGENVRLNAVVINKTQNGQPMTLARVGLPGGLTFQTWQLKELKDKGLIAFYETRAREVILYFRDLKPAEQKTIPLDLVATVPGDYTAPASSAYLYYNDEHKTWAPALTVRITP